MGDVLVNAKAESEIRRLLSIALVHGKGVVHILSEMDGLEAVMQLDGDTTVVGRVTVASSLRACPLCATSYPELDPRLFSYNSKHGWCTDCVGTGVRLNKDQRKTLDDSTLEDREKAVNSVLQRSKSKTYQTNIAPSARVPA